MNIDEFFNRLATTKDKLEWKLRGPYIRGYIKDGRHEIYCPITAVCKYYGIFDFSKDRFQEAGHFLGLQSEEVMDIANASDHYYKFLFNGELACPKLNKLRERLLKTIFEGNI